MNPDLQRLQIKLLKALRGFPQSNPYAFVDAVDAPEAAISMSLHQGGRETPLLASDTISILYEDGQRYANFRLGELLLLARLGGPFLGGEHGTGVPGPHTREGDPETSHAAAEGLSELRLSEMRKMILRIHLIEGEDGLTDIDLVRLCDGDQRRSTIRTRRSELTDHGYIEDSGRRKHQEGSARVIWVLTAKGRAEAESLVGVQA